jgi:hypothetical protein
MTRYRAYMHLGGQWHVADIFNTWPDAVAWMAMCDENDIVAVVAVKDGPIDRSIMETGKLPSETKQQIAQLGAAIRARRAVARQSPKEN